MEALTSKKPREAGKQNCFFLQTSLDLCHFVKGVAHSGLLPSANPSQNALPEPPSGHSKLTIPVIFPTLRIFKRFTSYSFPKFLLIYFLIFLVAGGGGAKPRVLHMPGKHSSTEFHAQAWSVFVFSFFMLFAILHQRCPLWSGLGVDGVDLLCNGADTVPAWTSLNP